MESVAITGMGLVCALGATLREAWPRLVAGEHGFRPISRFDASAYGSRIAAEVGAFATVGPDVPQGGDSPLRRSTRLFLAAAAEAWRDAGLTADDATAAQAGVVAGASVNYVHMSHIRVLWAARDRQTGQVDTGRALSDEVVPSGAFFRRHGETMAAATAVTFGLGGPRIACDTACASGAHAIADAYRIVARGDAPIMLAGGGSGLIMPVTILAFSRIGALTSNADPATASRPFDRRRDGFVLGEGAAVVVLERIPAARARRARVYAEIAGAASTVNAHSLTDPSPGGETEAMTMTLAMRDAGMAARDIGYIAAHGTSTPKNDVTETLAIKRALGERAESVLVSSHKGQLGHTLPAAGAINVVLAATALARQTVPPTAHLSEPDPECDLDYVPGVGRRAVVRAALCNAFAFGGQNTVIVLRGAAQVSKDEFEAPQGSAGEAA
jgi:3-oxoacyl-(acyl-carrier-protein) synthase